MEKYVVEYYEYGKYIKGCDMYFDTYEDAKEYVKEQRKFNREEHLDGMKYKIMVVEE